jgi:hypothetical protein
VLVAVVVFVVAAVRRDEAPSASSSRGSGISATDRREVAPVTGVDLAGANTL